MRSRNWPQTSKFQSTRPAGGATKVTRSLVATVIVSIHAPRGGRDYATFYIPRRFMCFNPRAPRGARPARAKKRDNDGVFQSTRPAGGATPPDVAPVALDVVSIHAPRGGRDSITPPLV